MKKCLKQVVSICLMAAMLCGLLTGCGGNKGSESQYTDKADEKVTLRMALPLQKQKDADTVLAKINEKLATLLPNTELEIIWEGNMETKWSLWMATKEPIDIAHSGFVTDLSAEVSKQSYVVLDSLIDEYAPNLKTDEETYWYTYDTARINGKLYAVPNTQIHINNVLTIEMATDVIPYIDVEAISAEGMSSDVTTERFWQLVDESLDNAAANGYDMNGRLGMEWRKIAQKGYVFIGGADSNICYRSNGDGEILDYYTTDEFKVYCEYMQKWANKGYISQDALTGNIGWWTRNINPYYIEEGSVIAEGVINNCTNIIIEDYENKVLTTDIGRVQTYWSIPFTSEHPARAIRFLDLLQSEEGAEIANLLAFGLEGTHYEFTDKENGDIKAYEYSGQGGSTVSYGVPSWYVTNMLEGLYTVEPYTHEYKNFAKNYYLETVNKMEKNVLYGFAFDISTVKVPLSNILKNNAELASNVYSGIVANSEATYNELMEKNKAAGIEDVISTLQEQADDYISSQK